MAKQPDSGGRAYEDIVRGGHVVDDLTRALRMGETGLDMIPRLIRSIIEDELWRERKMRTGKIAKFSRFIDFIVAKPLEGLGEDPAAIKRLISADPVVLRLFEGAITNRVGKPAADNTDNVSNKPSHGNTKAYTLRRLAKDRPDLLAKVEGGEMSANQAAIEAGFRKVKTPFEIVLALWPKLSDEEKVEAGRRLGLRPIT